MKRTHDNIYLNEDNRKVKDSFVAVANKIAEKPFSMIADVGCATGAFPAYLKEKFPKNKIVGIEYLKNLLNKAERDFPNVRFLQGDVTIKSSVQEQFDVITMLGVLCIFDDYASVLANVLSWLKPRGRLILHNMVSEF